MAVMAVITPVLQTEKTKRLKAATKECFVCKIHFLIRSILLSLSNFLYVLEQPLYEEKINTSFCWHNISVWSTEPIYFDFSHTMNNVKTFVIFSIFQFSTIAVLPKI